MDIWQITSGWGVVSSVASVVAALGIIALICQVCILRKQTALNAFSSLLQQWGGKEERKARRYVMKEFKFGEKDSLEDLDDDCLDKVELVLAMCHRTSFLASRGFIREKDVSGFVGRSMVRLWDRSEDFVKARRRQYGEPEKVDEASYVYHFQQFVLKNRGKLEANK